MLMPSAECHRQTGQRVKMGDETEQFLQWALDSHWDRMETLLVFFFTGNWVEKKRKRKKNGENEF